MQQADGLALRGEIILEQRRGGKLVERKFVRNLITNGGLAWLAGAITGDTATPTDLKYIGLGTGTTAAAATDTGLETPTADARATGTVTRVTTTTANDTVQIVGTITAGGARAVTEAGLFSAASDGTLGARQVFSVMNLASGDTLQVTWKIIAARAA